ncbi:DUF5991 domain-containing protein [Methylobacterium radiodurans]|uniref:Uncharacterized protein n=1 Tax=Methylobacterium radiodurans TaxID=2202828 RepID=A0A2U8VT87_9HYPH|nr:DUF5991 domain-containing protein [Methylobacterium radiodurans]AWN36915.1 hypothetical protein DK427_15205 [Methylobacterium radiodurans]
MRIDRGRTMAAALASVLLAGGAGAAGDWQGRYRWEAVGGRTAGGTGIAVTYDLAIGPPGARGGCLLTAQGFQTDERILCKAEAGARGLTVAFHSYADGRTVNRYGVAVHQPGEPLFTLTREATRGESGLITRLQGLRPLNEGAPVSGTFFARVP